MRPLILLTVAFWAVTTSLLGFAGDHLDLVKAQLILIKQVGLSQGYQETHDDKFDRLNSGDADSFNLTLHKGMSYKVVAVCDKDCSDLDLILYDGDGNEVGRDQSNDSTPIVDIDPLWTGNFSLKVLMYSCNDDPCYYGISVLGK